MQEIEALAIVSLRPFDGEAWIDKENIPYIKLADDIHEVFS
jgi:hypothetical protein